MASRTLARLGCSVSKGLLQSSVRSQRAAQVALSARNGSTSPNSENPQQSFSIKNGDGKRLPSSDFYAVVKEAVAKDVPEEEFVLPKEAFGVIGAEYDALREENADLLDKYRRALADTENVRRRGQKQVEDTKIFAIQGFCKDLLEVADILDMAVQAVNEKQIEENPQVKSLHEGVAMTKTVLLKTFAKHGLVPINPVGEKFDPNKHDALFEVPAEMAKVEPGHVAQVMKIGYSLRERTIRPANVGVAKGN
uniref:GrpE protein homolog n=1 Tax=Steinernema glaseri TaxID=37863 RepID=A0A1I7YWU0_9BILA